MIETWKLKNIMRDAINIIDFELESFWMVILEWLQ